MDRQIMEFLQNNWSIVIIINSLVTLVFTPIVIAFINKKTISFSSTRQGLSSFF